MADSPAGHREAESRLGRGEQVGRGHGSKDRRCAGRNRPTASACASRRESAMRRTAVSCMALLVGAMGCGHSEDEWQQAMHIRRELTADLDAANKAHADREGILRSLTARVETLRRSVSADSQTAPPPASVLASAPTTAPPSIPDVPNPPAPALRPTDADLGGSPQPTAFAVVVGVEKYSAQLPAPIGARADAERFRELAVRSFGIAPNHIQMVLDEQATKGGIERALAWARASTPSGGRIYFYFSGHGAPDTSTGTSATPYIVPYDGDPSFLDATAIPVQEVLTKLSQSSAREVLAFLDSCFSGAGGRSVLPSGERPLVRVKVEQAPA